MFSERTHWRLTQNRFTQAVEEVRARGTAILDLTASNPTRVGLKYDSARILSALQSEHALDYDPQAKGLLSAREAVARYYRDTSSVDPESIVLTASTSEGYSYVFRLLCNAGDELLVPKPSYPLFEFLADLQDVKLVPYPLIYDHGWQMDFHSLEKAVTTRTRGVVIVHPNNPTGSYVKPSELAPFNEFCQKHGLPLIVDEVFLDYVLDAQAYSSFVRNGKVLTFTLSGLSKICALPQMKLAWLIASGPEELKREALARVELIADTYLSPSAPVQHAAADFLAMRNAVQDQLIKRLEANLAELDRQLSEQRICERLDVEGGWYAVLRVPVTRTDEQLAVELLEQQSVVVHPGLFFDFDSDGYLVLSLITPEAIFAEGVRRVLKSVH